jgi:ubiquitin carboxyl-terminal hydrolase 4/11/15
VIESVDLSGGCEAKDVTLITLVQRREVKQTWTNTKRLEKFSNPRVIMVSPETTTQAVQDAVKAIAKGSLPDADSSSYSLIITDTYCYEAGSALPCDESTMSPLITKNKNLSIDWTEAAVNSFKTTAKEQHPSMQASSKGVAGGIPLADCMARFTAQEKLDADNAVYCSVCKEHKESSKKFDVWSLPKVLIIHLKRFQQQRWGNTGFGGLKKVDTVVDFPDDLDMAPFMISVQPGQKTQYKLFAVSNHSGGMGGGHYFTYAKGGDGPFEEREWYEYNDSSVRKMDADRVRTGAAYVLFYERMDD